METEKTNCSDSESIPPQTKSLLSETRELLRRFDLKAKKSLGQHFLIDRGVLRHVIAAAELSPKDIVIEIGAGLGVLTRELALRAGQVIAVELDSHLAELLRKELHSFGNITVVNRDILEVDPEALLKEAISFQVDPLCYKVVANLPYYITSAVLRHFLTARLKPGGMVVMMQREVARAIVAKPGDMSLLAVSVQFYGKPTVVRTVSARSFYPAPEVSSAILKIELYPHSPLPVTDEASFFELVRAGFTNPRKQITNSLAQGLGIPKADVLSLLEKAGIAHERRSETLTLEEWARLWHIYSESRKLSC